MKFAKTPRYAVTLLGALALLCATVAAPRAEGHAHGTAPDPPERQGRAGALVRAVREATERFKNVEAAEAAGYHLMFGCVSGPDYGAMGMHYVNLPLVMDGKLNVDEPEIVIYEPQPNGSLKLIGADYLVFAAPWNASHSATPTLMGQLMHLIEAPNRYGLDAFYTLHVWAWKESSTGPFVNWHPSVSCASFPGQPD